MTKIVSHRGFCYEYSENTMLAFSKAIEVGCDGIELDVQLSADGEIVIIHDETVDRTTDGVGLVREKTLAELKALNAYGAFPNQFGFQPIITLKEYFQYVADKPIFTNIELKNNVFDYPKLEEKVIALVRSFELESRIEFSSFNHFSMLRCKELAAEIPVGLLTSSWIVGVGAYGKSLGVDYINPNYAFSTAEHVAEIKAHGLDCNTWTVNTAKLMKPLFSLNVASIITNRPDIAMEIRGHC